MKTPFTNHMSPIWMMFLISILLIHFHLQQHPHLTTPRVLALLHIFTFSLVMFCVIQMILLPVRFFLGV